MAERLPFTNEQFFGVFADYNRTFAFVVAVIWLIMAAAVAAAWRDPRGRRGALSYGLAALWLWNAVAYHALFFTRINPAAWLFAALFAVQAMLFVRAAWRGTVDYFASTGWTRVAGIILVGYAFAYPFLTMALGHEYPATPTFGVPCPTDLLTMGLLVTTRGRPPLALAIIPIVWGFIGGSAAALLGVPTDYMLLGAALLLTTLVLVPVRHSS